MNPWRWYWYIPGVTQTKGVPYQGPYENQSAAQLAMDEYRERTS
jgi:hypothetical protein